MLKAGTKGGSKNVEWSFPLSVCLDSAGEGGDSQAVSGCPVLQGLTTVWDKRALSAGWDRCPEWFRATGKV